MEANRETASILIIEDDTALAQGLVRALATDERQVACCATLRDADRILRAAPCDLILLDVNLPDGNGYDHLPIFRERYPAISVVMLTANDLESDIVAGLERGADDYITKPFSLAVLRARIDTQLRRRNAETAGPEGTVCAGDCRFDFDRMEFYRAGRPIALSRSEQKLLRVLTANPGITLTRDRLRDAVWSADSAFVDENALSVTVKRLRDKLGPDGACIKTVYGIGYVWSQQ